MMLLPLSRLGKGTNTTTRIGANLMALAPRNNKFARANADHQFLRPTTLGHSSPSFSMVLCGGGGGGPRRSVYADVSPTERVAQSAAIKVSSFLICFFPFPINLPKKGDSKKYGLQLSHLSANT
jgi:hypothetical protein